MARGYLSEDESRARDESTVTIEDAKCVRASKHAIFVRIGENGPQGAARHVWIPQSVVHADSEVFAEKQEGKLVIMAWWARKEGLQP